MSSVPIRNVYYLLSYAWDALAESKVIGVEKLDYHRLGDLFAHVLCGAVDHVLRRGLERSYHPVETELTRLQGRVRLVESEARLLFQKGIALCSTDELNANSLANQIVRATLKRLSAVVDLDRNLRRRLLDLHREMRDIDEIRVSRPQFGQVQVHSNNSYYRFLLNVCELAWDSCLVDERSGSARFRDFLRDDRKMALLFQKFVCNFCRIKKLGLEVGPERIEWKSIVADVGSRRVLPLMRTDVSMWVRGKKLIIDTKYYAEALSTYFDTDRVRSEHLYQLLAYLSNAVVASDTAVEGLLLYPTTRGTMRFCFDELQGFRVRVCSLNLDADWAAIESELISIVTDAQVPSSVNGRSVVA